MREGVTLLIDKGVTLYGSRDPKDYDPDPAGPGGGLCGTMSTPPTASTPASNMRPQGRGCKPLISIMNIKNAAIMGDGIIDGRGGATLIGHDYSWWQMVRQSSAKHLRSFNTRLIVANHADGLILYRITLHNSPNFHVTVGGTDGFTAWGVHLLSPTVKGTDAPNTDGIDPGSSTNVTITKSWIDNGDDNVAIKTGVTHMSVLDNHFYTGHGMSIGSETNTGDNFLLVDGLTEDHTTSGIREAAWYTTLSTATFACATFPCPSPSARSIADKLSKALSTPASPATSSPTTRTSPCKMSLIPRQATCSSRARTPTTSPR
jgi:polygalacturonase